MSGGAQNSSPVKLPSDEHGTLYIKLKSTTLTIYDSCGVDINTYERVPRRRIVLQTKGAPIFYVNGMFYVWFWNRPRGKKKKKLKGLCAAPPSTPVEVPSGYVRVRRSDVTQDAWRTLRAMWRRSRRLAKIAIRKFNKIGATTSPRQVVVPAVLRDGLSPDERLYFYTALRSLPSIRHYDPIPAHGYRPPPDSPHPRRTQNQAQSVFVRIQERPIERRARKGAGINSATIMEGTTFERIAREVPVIVYRNRPPKDDAPGRPPQDREQREAYNRRLRRWERRWTGEMRYHMNTPLDIPDPPVSWVYGRFRAMNGRHLTGWILSCFLSPH